MTHNDEEAMLNDPLNKKTAEIEETTYTNISPMILESAITSKNKNDSLCIRFLRKQCLCIIILLLLIITLTNLLNTFIGKMSENDIASIVNSLKFVINGKNRSYFNTTIDE